MYNNNKVELVPTCEVENMLAELFQDSYYTLNIETGEFGCIDMAYMFAYSAADVDTTMFDAEEIEKLPSIPDMRTIYIVGFNQKNPSHSIVKAFDMEELTYLIESAYRTGMFIGDNIYEALRDMATEICHRYYPGYRIFRSLLERTNSVLLKDGTAVVATIECYSSIDRFYETLLKTESDEKPTLLMNFGSSSYASIYAKPSNELFGLKADDNVAAFQDPKLLEEVTYELCLTNPNMESILVLSMSCDGHSFNIKEVNVYPEYRGLKQIIDSHYNKAEDIIHGIMEYNIASHTEDLLSFID